jgi:hypothetical protein
MTQSFEFLEQAPFLGIEIKAKPIVSPLGSDANSKVLRFTGARNLRLRNDTSKDETSNRNPVARN